MALELATGLKVDSFVAIASDIERALAVGDAETNPAQARGPDDDADAGDFVEHLRRPGE